MVTAITVKEKIQGLIDKSNNTTGANDTTLTDAVNALIEGYGSGGDNTVVDVESLPTENVDATKIYKSIVDGKEVFGIPSDATVKRLVDGAWVEL